MKRFYTLLSALLFLTASLTAQSPEKLNYQAVVRDGSNQLVKNSTIGLRIQILQGSEFGAAEYVETHTPESNGNGVINLEIGNGTIVNGDFSGIDWSDGPYFLKTEVDPDGSDNYSITTTTELLSVPYALYAEKAAEVEKTPTAFNVIGGTFQDLPADETTTINFTDSYDDAGSFIENNVFSLDADEYTAPEKGIYFFESVVTIDTRSNPPERFWLYYYVNGFSAAKLRYYAFDDGDNTGTRFNTTLRLEEGDKVTLRAKPFTNPTSTLGGNSSGVVRMTGFKVE